MAGRPEMMLDYDLIIDDSKGWAADWESASNPNQVQKVVQLTGMMRTAVNGGKHMIFTDIAMKDMVMAFPKYMTIVGNGISNGVENEIQCEVNTLSESPAQYSGAKNITVKLPIGGVIIRRPVAASVRVVLDSDDYNGDYRMMAAYFYYGKGTV